MAPAISIPAKIRGDFMYPRIANQENENPGEQLHAGRGNIKRPTLPVPKEFELYDYRYNNQRKRNANPPSQPKCPFESLPGNQGKDEDRQFARKTEQILFAIGFDCALANPRVNMQEADDRNRNHGKCASSKNGRSQPVATQQGCNDHEADAEKKDRDQGAPPPFSASSVLMVLLFCSEKLNTEATEKNESAENALRIQETETLSCSQLHLSAIPGQHSLGINVAYQVYNIAVPQHELGILFRKRKARNEIARLKRGNSRRIHDGRKEV
jgi:hypothetical protein